MAAGTGRLLADWLSGEQPQIDTEGLTIDRYAPARTASRRVGPVASA
jgi:glycine/D-amino acid oxidase-like deaminating enzyme